jgi:dihydroflavonol-4-reductase
MRAFITGAGGLIGTNLVRELVARGVAVRAMVRRARLIQGVRDADVELCTGDVLDSPEVLAGPMAGCDLLFHAATPFAYSGIDEDALERTATIGTRNVLRAAAVAGVRRVVVTSSSVVFGSSEEPSPRDESSVPEARFVEPGYVRAKIKQAELAIAEGARLGLEVVLVCPTMSLGYPTTNLGPSNAIVVAYLSDPLRMTYPGGCNLVSVRDIARGHWLAAERGEPGQCYLLGSEDLHWHEIHSLIAELCGVGHPAIEINHAAAYLAATYEELRARLRGREPLTTRTQARMVGRYYWYSHARAGQLGYAPRPARAALAEACAGLAASPHVSREIRATMTLHPEVHAARTSALQCMELR